MESISTPSFEIALANIKVVYGAVKAAGVWTTASDYEDYVQEGLIMYAKILDHFKDTKLELAEINRLAFKKIMWLVIDKLRRQKLASEYFVGLDDILDFKDTTVVQDKSELVELLCDILPELSVVEVLILQRNLLQGDKITDLVEQTACSYRTLSRAKASLLVKLRKIFGTKRDCTLITK